MAFFIQKYLPTPKQQKEPHLRINDLNTLNMFIVYISEFNLCLILKLKCG